MPLLSRFPNFPRIASAHIHTFAMAAQNGQAKRSSHPVFKTVESERPPLDKSATFSLTKTAKPDWTPGSGANDASWKLHKTLEINPYAKGRNPIDNYKLLISGIIPRPVGFVSTVSKDATSTNLSPFSYFNVVNHDPPIFCIGFSGSLESPKDTCRNLLETGECTINIISEWFSEAANYTATNAPHGVSEWALSGLTPAKSTIVRPSRVAESAFSIEAVLKHQHEWESRAVPGKKTGVLVILEGVNFHVREDALKEGGNVIDPAVLKPVSRLGGISYSRTTTGFELPRPEFTKEVEKGEVKDLVKPKVDGQ